MHKVKYFLNRNLAKLKGLFDYLSLLFLTKGKYYGSDISIQGVDQLGSPDPTKIEKPYGQIYDKESAKRFGTSNLEEYSYWAWRACGVANAATILLSKGLYDGTLFSLVEDLVARGGYVDIDRRGNKDVGWRHAALCELLIRYGIPAKVKPFLPLYSLLKVIANSGMVIASVKSKLVDSGGHMVLITGMAWQGKDTILEIFNPYNLDSLGGKQRVKLSEFAADFRNRGIIVWPNIKTD